MDLSKTNMRRFIRGQKCDLDPSLLIAYVSFVTAALDEIRHLVVILYCILYCMTVEQSSVCICDCEGLKRKLTVNS